MIELAILAYLSIAIYRVSAKHGNNGCLGIIGLLMLVVLGETVGVIAGLLVFGVLTSVTSAPEELMILAWPLGIVGFLAGARIAFNLASRPAAAKA